MNCSKKAIKTARCRLIHLKNKRKTIALHLRNDLAELILNGYEEVAINRVCIYILYSSPSFIYHYPLHSYNWCLNSLVAFFLFFKIYAIYTF